MSTSETRLKEAKMEAVGLKITGVVLFPINVLLLPWSTRILSAVEPLNSHESGSSTTSDQHTFVDKQTYGDMSYLSCALLLGYWLVFKWLSGCSEIGSYRQYSPNTGGKVRLQKTREGRFNFRYTYEYDRDGGS